MAEKKTPIEIQPTSLDGTVKNTPFDYDDYIKCAVCGTVVYPSGNNIFLTHCPHCGTAWVAGMKQLFPEKFLEDAAEQGYELPELLDGLGEELIAFHDWRRRRKRGRVMRNYPSAFDKKAVR